MAIYECNYCSSKFKISIKLNEHLIAFHKNTFTPEGYDYLKKQLQAKKEGAAKRKQKAADRKIKKKAKKGKTKRSIKPILIGTHESNRRRH